MATRFNPPPNWPPSPAGWQPTPGWTPDPAWGPPPAGWRLWVEGEQDGSGATRAEVAGSGNWFARHKIWTGVGAVVAALVVIGAVSDPNPPTDPVSSSDQLAVGDVSSASPSPQPTRTQATRAAVTPTERPTPTPVISTATVVETAAVPFAATTREDSTMAAGTSAVTVAGVNGVRTVTYAVIYTDGVETSREVVSDEITTAPVDEVTSVGTYVAPAPAPAPAPPPADDSDGCDPNYTGACVPIDSDVDCAGGSGNGPSYVKGPVTVVGSDIYGLDNDHDGIGCES